jgi:hypothetical protein
MAVSLSYSFNGTAQEGLEREAEEVLALWEEVGSKGLDTWLELPAGYAIEEDSGSELERGYDYSLLVEDYFTMLEAEEEHDDCPTWLKRLFSRMKDACGDTYRAS